MIRCFLNLNKVRLLQDSWMGQTSVERLHGRLDVLHTSFPPSPSWIQDGCGGNDVIQDLGRVFRPLLRRRRKMAALPLPVAILDDLISGSRKWGHPRWRPEAEGPPFSSASAMGIEKPALYYSNGNIFGITDPLCGEFTCLQWIPLTKASDAELWYFLWSAPEQTGE